MEQPVRVIKTQQGYEAALARLSALMDEDIAPGSDEESELELLALVIQAYERDKVEPPVSDPIEAILFRMDQQNLQKKDMVPYFGSLSKVSEVLARKRPLSVSMMRKLHKGLGIPADVLLGDSEADHIDLSVDPSVDYLKFPLSEMLERRYFAGFAGSLRLAKEHVEELIGGFFQGISSTSMPLARLRARLHQDGSRMMDEYALLVWQAAVLKKARLHPPRGQYKQGCVTEEWLRELARFSRFDQGPRLAQEFLSDAGIALVIERHFKKTYLDGAAMLDGERPIVALTLRHDRVDNFWFALMHELVHVQKHLREDRLFIADNLDDKTRSSKEEKQADQGALDALIPPDAWKAATVRVRPIKANALALAESLRIHPAIVAGRVRFEASNWRLLPTIQATVSEHFQDQLMAGC